MTVRISTEVLSAAVSLIEGSYNKPVTRSFMEPFLGGLLTALISFYFGLLYGSSGFVYALIFSSGLVYYNTKDCFKPLEEIVRNELDPEDREELHLLILKTVRDLQARDLDHFNMSFLLTLLLNAVSVQQGVLNTVEKFLFRAKKLSCEDLRTKKKRCN